MNTLKQVLFAVFAFGLLSFSLVKNDSSSPVNSTTANHQFYQLKIYSFNTSEQVEGADHYLKNAFIPTVNAMGISNVGVFKPTSIVSDTLKKIYVLIPFSSVDEFIGLEKKLEQSESHNTKGSSFLNAPHNEPAYARYESILLRSFDDFPALTTPKLNSDRSKRIYELRSYEGSSNKYYKTKVDMFNAGGEIKLFDRLGFNAVFYGEVVSGANMPNLMYMTTFSDMESRDAHWDTFRKDSEWLKLKAVKKYKNTVSHADIILMYPTDYSNY